MKNETEKLNEKRALFIQGGFMLSDDSLNQEVINPEFQAIDQDLKRILIPEPTTEEKRTNNLVKELLNGNKISLGC